MKRDVGLTLAARLVSAITIGMMTMLSIVRSEAATELVQRISEAENYPHKPIRIIDAFPAGGSTDAMARLMGQKFTERFGQTVVVENRVGATGNLGAQFAAKAAPADLIPLFFNINSRGVYQDRDRTQVLKYPRTGPRHRSSDCIHPAWSVLQLRRAARQISFRVRLAQE